MVPVYDRMSFTSKRNAHVHAIGINVFFSFKSVSTTISSKMREM